MGKELMARHVWHLVIRREDAPLMCQKEPPLNLFVLLLDQMVHSGAHSNALPSLQMAVLQGLNAHSSSSQLVCVCIRLLRMERGHKCLSSRNLSVCELRRLLWTLCKV